MDTHIGIKRASVHKTDQAFKFYIRGDSITRATVTIHARNIDDAWNRLHILFPESDISDIDVKLDGQP